MNSMYSRFLFLFASLFCLQSTAWCEPASRISSATLSLTVRDSILMALENNRSLTVDRYGPDVAETFVVEESAVFDPTLSSDLSGAKSSGQRTSGVGEFRTVENQQVTGSLGVAKQYPVGLGVEVGALVRRQDSNVYTTLFSTRLGASFTLPVLEGFGSNVNLVGVMLAQKDVELSRYELQGYVLAMAAQVEEYYWDLLLAREELTIHLASLDLARKQMLETKDRIDVGELPEIELAAAEGEVALREKDVIDAHSVIDKTTLRFIQSINPPANDIWSLHVDLLDSYSLENINLGPVEKHMSIADKMRPDLNQARVELEKREMQLVRTKNGLLPRLDFFVDLGKTGYSNTYEETFSNLTEDNYDATGGFVFTYNLGNRAAKARHNRAEFQEREATAALRNFEQLVELDVRIAYRELLRATQQITASRKATQLQEAKYQAETEKFKVGKSTNILVLAAQRDLTRSRLDEIESRISLRKAILGLYQAEGVLLDQRQIVMPQMDHLDLNE